MRSIEYVWIYYFKNRESIYTVQLLFNELLFYKIVLRSFILDKNNTKSYKQEGRFFLRLKFQNSNHFQLTKKGIFGIFFIFTANHYSTSLEFSDYEYLWIYKRRYVTKLKWKELINTRKEDEVYSTVEFFIIDNVIFISDYPSYNEIL